ncbi:MAG: YcgN family cysteine cluster protein [Alphaproteobacteria bacterium]|nr:YcgN family cysteine cluster protein [Alphaproteobacteria bacterium]
MGKELGTPFWRKPLAELSKAEWEALCDGCGRCCLVKLEDEDSGRIYHTDIVCNLFDKASCRCSSYKDRHDHVPDCVTLNRRNVQQIAWLPPTCAYKLRAAGEDLPWWHYLVSGSRETVHAAGISCRGRTGPKESEIALDDYPSRIVRWRGNAPRGRRAPAKPEKAGAKSRANAGKN